MSEQLVTLTIDGRTVQVPKGTLLVEAAKKVGIEIPVFCYHPKLDPAGVCRMCLVQIEKIPKPQTACTTPVGDGMVVHTNTEQVQNLRKGALEFLLINHPLDCPVCDKGGECDLQDLTYEHGPSTSRMQDAKIRKNKVVDLGNFIVLDNERCILCRRCTRFDDQVATEGNLIVQERAHFNHITTLEDQPYNSYFSGNTIELCPVGALTSDLYRFKARPWDLSKVDSVCSMCSVGCEVKQEFRHGRLLRLTAKDIDTVDNGWMCDRGRFNYQFIHSEDRLTEPMVNKGGAFAPVTWSEAIAAITAKVNAVKAAKGGKGFGVIGGGRLTNEEAYLLQKFARLTLGTGNVDHRVDDQLIASLATFPGKQADLSDASAILIVDTDPAETAPVMDLRIRRMADRKKARIAVVGSVMPKYRGRHARIQTKPGQTAAVIEALAAAAAGKQPSASVADAEAVTRLMGLLTMGHKVVIVWGGNDAATGRALTNLAAALKKPAGTGEVGRSVHVLIPGAQNNSRGAEAMGVLPNFFPGFAAAADKKAQETVAALWGARNLPAENGLTTGQMLKAAAAGDIEVLFLMGANLLNTYPDRKLVAAALEKAFVVSADIFANETVQQADVVLPAASIGEKSGTFTALDGVVRVAKAAKKGEGAAQPDGDILVGLAAALGTKLSNSPQETASEIGKLVAKLQAGVVLPGAPASVLPAAAETAVPEGLLLVPVAKLYAGGSTAQFDEGFNHVLPKPEAAFNPADAAALGLQAGELVELTAGGAAIRMTVKLDKGVVPGTVQAIRGLTAAPVNALTTGNAPVAVTVAKLAVEVAD
ncbi:MAG TPA: NADH-quinone oxidoreductase subunit NuoG [Symbiobacteriaceae bacterium]|nr:NADH-quinone oxidoreductase subunit NuoG [Symbiobacteriaceae bacterium]